MTIWPPKRDALTRPTYRSLAQCLVEAVRSGAVQPGARLPTHRALAYDLGLSVQTVSRAYDELRRLGVIHGEVGRGSFVRYRPVDASTPWHRGIPQSGVIDCSMLVPVTGGAQADYMSRTLRELAADPPESMLFSFRPRATLEAHCRAARDWISRCGLDVEADRIVPSNGATAAMHVALMTAVSPGDLVVTEEMGHHTLKSLTHAMGLRLRGVAIDGEGIRPDALESMSRSNEIKAVFVHPSGLNATAALMSEERRLALAEVARRRNLLIIENDAWGPVQPERSPPLARIAPERTFYITGLSKCLLPGLRIGWLVPPGEYVHTARARHLVSQWMATPLMAEIAMRWLVDGSALELLRWQRQQLQRRNELALGMLGDAEIRSVQNGLHVWAPLTQPWREEDFVAHALQNGVAVASGANFAIEDTRRHFGVRIALGAGSEDDLANGLSIIARLLRSEPEPAVLPF